MLENQNYQQQTAIQQNKSKVVKAIRKEVVLPLPIKEEEPENPRVIRLDEPEEKNDSDLDDEIQSELNELN